MPRKQVGMVDDALLARVDARAGELGQSRRVFTERALEAALRDETPRPSPAGRQAKSEAASSSRPARSAAASPLGASRPSASPRTSAANSLGKGTFTPIPKGGKG